MKQPVEETAEVASPEGAFEGQPADNFLMKKRIY